MSKYLLVRYSVDYADEFYVDGMKIFTEDEYISFINNQRYAMDLERDGKLQRTGRWGDIEIYFGSNEYLLFDNVSEIIKVFEVQEITEQEFNTLKNLGLDSFGDRAIFDFFEDIRE